MLCKVTTVLQPILKTFIIYIFMVFMNFTWFNV